MNLITKLTTLLACAAVFTGAAQAADKTVKVRFKAGASSATISGSIKGYDGVNYVLDARAGQTVSVLFNTRHSSCYFNFFEPGGGQNAVHIGSVDGNEYADNLSRSGRIRTQVYMMRAAARRGEVCRYSITFEITG
jgi:hypothetical protein